MSKHVFISDLHLDETRPDLTDAFFRFLDDVASDADSLYILGDFFEVWLGDDHDTPFNQQVIERLRGVAATTYVMHGNRDFLIGDAFCKAAGVTLLPDPCLIELDGTEVLLMHGDSLCTLDEKYMQARGMLRSPAFQADFLGKSLEERAAFARQIRGESKEHTRETADDIMDVTPEEVIRVMSEASITTLIHGHTHRPATHQVDLNGVAGTRYVLGDWHTSTWYLTVTDGKPELIKYAFG